MYIKFEGDTDLDTNVIMLTKRQTS